MFAQQQIALATAIKEQLALMSVEDETLVHDTLEGETDIYECMDWLLGKIAHEDAFIEGLDIHMVKLGKRFDSASTRRHKWRDLLQQAMEATGEKTVKRPAATITLAPKAIGIQSVDESLVPEEFFTIETIRKLDKKKLKEAAIAGGVAGVVLDNGGVSLRVRT